MKKISWQIALSIGLVFLSAAVYYIHFIIFRDAHHIFLYLIGDIAFVFIEVLMVTIIIHRLLSQREKHAMLNKLNMVIGTFFSEVGSPLLQYLITFDEKTETIRKNLMITTEWTKQDYRKIHRQIHFLNTSISAKKGDLEQLKKFLMQRRDFLLRLLENQNLLEHESFTNLLWAVFHLTEELSQRKNLSHLPDADYNHLGIDIKRVYTILIDQWVSYMQHLQKSYPYLFSLAVRMNPVNPNATAVIKR
ncbi:MAG: hypothetical protein GF384_04730 [Elusimicrobia bacterium]|nr:hypothetical protein [Elusimicrobiota bacterium]MBD3412132.1 hypothetical protein [Elusimicrobiota bacterium]